MPSNITDHDKWERAKKQAAKQGQGENYAYISGIYQQMGGGYTSKTKKGDAFHIIVDDNQPMAGSDDDSGLMGVGAQYDRATMTEGNGGLSKARGIVSGQIPRVTIPSSLTAMPKGPLTAEKRLSFDEPVHTPAGITRGLALNSGQEHEIQAQVQANIHHPEVAYRTSLNQKLTYMRLDSMQRKAIATRAARYYRDQGFDQSNLVTLQRRLRGLRKSEEGGLPEEWGVLLAAPNPDGSRKKCSNCMMWVTTNQCHIHAKDEVITGAHTCGYHVYGQPETEWMDHPGIDPVKPKWSGLELVPEGTACDNCAHYAGEDGSGRCLAVAGHPKVLGRMCCARWKAVPEKFFMSYAAAMDAAGEKLAKQIYDDTGDDSHPDFKEWMRKGGAGSRGGRVIGYTASGKPIYYSSARKEHNRGFTAKDHRAAAEHHRKKRKEAGADNPGTARHHRESAEHHESAASTLANYHGEDKPWPNEQEHHDEHVKTMSKAEPRGGSYHMRVTNKDTGKHRYYYDEDKYTEREGHVSGRGVLKKKCRGQLMKRVGKGCTVESLKGFGGYDDELIKDAIRDSVRAGELVHDNGNLKPAAKKLGAAGAKG